MRRTETKPLPLPGMEEISIMVEQLKKKLTNPDSLISLFLGLAVVGVIAVLIFNYVKERKGPGSVSQPGATSEQQTATGSSLPTTYTVTEGETLWTIAAKIVGSGYNWVDIADANKLTDPNTIEVGQKLAIPSMTKREPGQIANANVKVKRPADGKYTVKKGDSLWTISLEVYGTGYRWPEIAKLNNLAEPNTIFTGNVLNLP